MAEVRKRSAERSGSKEPEGSDIDNNRTKAEENPLGTTETGNGRMPGSPGARPKATNDTKFSNSETPVQYSSVKEYTDELSRWIWSYNVHCMTSAACFYSNPFFFGQPPPGPSVFQQQYGPPYGAVPTAFTEIPAGRGPPQPLQHRFTFQAGTFPGFVAPPQQQPPPQQPTPSQTGLEFTIPSIQRRILAEIIDFTFLFITRLMIALILIEGYDIRDIDTLSKVLFVDIDNDISLTDTTINITYDDLHEMLILTLVYKLLVCFYETVFLWQGPRIWGRGPGGSTPGKFLLGLKVVRATNINLLDRNRIRVEPADSIDLFRAFGRSFIKIFASYFFMPIYFMALVTPYRRTLYDIMAGTIVVS